MSQPKRARRPQQAKPKRRQKKPAGVLERIMEEQPAAGKPAAGPIDAPAGTPGQANVAQLGDARFQTGQRRLIAAQLGQVGGNQFLQRLVGQMKQAEPGQQVQTLAEMTSLTSAKSAHQLQKEDDEPADPLTPAQVNQAQAWYARRRRQYTPEIIRQIQQQVGVEPDGFIGPITIQAVARWQQEHPPLAVDGKAGPRTLPAAFPGGLATTKATETFVGEARQVETKWATLGTADARATALVQAVNKQLTAAGVAACNQAITDLGPAAGQFDFPTWTLQMGQGPLGQATLTNEEAAEIADTVYHEGRHAEQWFRMAQMLAGRGRSAAAITREMSIPADIAKQAAGNPLKAGSMEALIAEGWYDSVYGASAAYRNQVLTDVKAKKTALDKAQAAFDKDPTPANQAKLDAAQKKFDAAYAKYIDLPEEADAHRVAAAAKAAFLGEK